MNTKMSRTIFLLVSLLLSVAFLVSCKDGVSGPNLPTDSVTINYLADGVEINNPFSNEGIIITNDNSHVVVTSTNSDKTINYILSGISSDGQLKIYSDKEFALSMNGISLTNASGGSAINIQSKASARIFLAHSKINEISDSGLYTQGDEDEKSTLFSEGALDFLGSGKLIVNSNSNKHGICSDKSVLITSGEILIAKSGNDGIHTNDKFEITGGKLSINTQSGDGIQSENLLLLNGGEIAISALSDGLKSDGDAKIALGIFTIKVTGDGSKCINTVGNLSITGGTLDLETTGSAYWDNSKQDMKSPAGIKCDNDINISNSNITINATGNGSKGINSDGSIVFASSNITINATGEAFIKQDIDTAKVKGIGATVAVTINSGTFKIYTPFENIEFQDQLGSEGIECLQTLTINGGIIDIIAGDDCINLGDEWLLDGQFNFNGGMLYCHSTYNDGIDCNGQMHLTGGFIIASGILESFDADREIIVTGGTYVGASPGLYLPDVQLSTQHSFVFRALKSGVEVCIKNSVGQEILKYRSPEFINDFPDRYAGGRYRIYFNSPLLVPGNYTIQYGGKIIGGANNHGIVTGGTYSGGKLKNFSISGKLTEIDE